MKLRTLPIWDWHRVAHGETTFLADVEGVARVRYQGVVVLSIELGAWLLALHVDGKVTHQSEHMSCVGAMNAGNAALRRAVNIREPRPGQRAEESAKMEAS